MLPNRSHLPAAVAGVLLPSVPRRGVPVARNEAHGEYSDASAVGEGRDPSLRKGLRQKADPTLYDLPDDAGAPRRGGQLLRPLAGADDGGTSGGTNLHLRDPRRHDDGHTVRAGLRRRGMSDYYPYPKRDPIKNYFPLPNEIFMLGLTPGELAVYSYLMRCEDRKTHQCHPSYRTIARAVHLSQNTVAKHVNGLREKRLIITENTEIVTRRGEKRNGTLLYTIRPVEEALRHFYEQQMNQLEAVKDQEKTQRKLAELDSKRERAG